MLSAGAALDTASDNGHTALVCAAQNGYSQVGEVRSLMGFCHDNNAIPNKILMSEGHFSVCRIFQQTFAML